MLEIMQEDNDEVMTAVVELDDNNENVSKHVAGVYMNVLMMDVEKNDYDLDDMDDAVEEVDDRYERKGTQCSECGC